MMWLTVLITPLIMVYELQGVDMMEKFLWVVWFNDISWCIEILVSFLVASDNDKTFKDISLNYLKGFFVLDVLATFPPMITN